MVEKESCPDDGTGIMPRPARLQSRLSRLWPIPYLPYPHFMALAPLDTWFRLLFLPRAAIPWRYWPRLAAALAISAVATAVTLPERLLVALWFRAKRPAPNRDPGPVFVLGGARSGTTHLQYLLDCDPNVFSPKWYHTLAPQGFILSWTLLRGFLIPFLPATRPMDAMPVNVDLASEDGFALNNWALASDMPGWSVLPRAHRFYDRFRDLSDLAPAERSRWYRCQRDFTHKLSFIARRRRLLLKTPSHTARVDALVDLFPRAKFIHITRDPKDVIRSNMKMLRMMQRRYALQDPLSEEAAEDGVVHRYLESERSYLAARADIPEGQLAEVRFQDLLADPVGEIERVYAELDLPFTDIFEQRLLAYLETVRSYTPNVHGEWTAEKTARIASIVGPLVEQFHLDEPTIPVKTPRRPPAPSASRERHRRYAVPLVGCIVAIGCAMAWFVTDTLTHDLHEWLVWPASIAIGYASVLTARRGSWKLGIWAALLTLCVLLGVVCANTWVNQYADHDPLPLIDLWMTTVSRTTVRGQPFWLFMGLVTAYRLGSRPRA